MSNNDNDVITNLVNKCLNKEFSRTENLNKLADMLKKIENMIDKITEKFWYNA